MRNTNVMKSRTSLLNFFVHIFVLSSIALFSSVVYADDKTALEYFEKGEDAFEDENFAEAKLWYERARSEKSSDGEIILKSNKTSKWVKTPRGMVKKDIYDDESFSYSPNARLAQIKAIQKANSVEIQNTEPAISPSSLVESTVATASYAPAASSAMYSISDYPAALPSFDFAMTPVSFRLKQASDLKGNTNIDQSASSEGQVVAAYTADSSLKFQQRVLSEPKGKVVRTSMISAPGSGNRIPVYYEGSKQVVDRVAVFDAKGHMYYTSPFGRSSDSSVKGGHFGKNKVRMNVVTQVNASMDNDGKINYRESNPFKAAKQGYKVQTSVGGAATSYLIPPSVALREMPVYSFSGDDGDRGYDGNNGSSGADAGTSGWGGAAISALGAIGGGSGGRGGNGRPGGNGSDGGNGGRGESPGEIHFTAKPFSSPFYSDDLVHYEHRRGGTVSKLFERSQNFKIEAIGGQGGRGGDGGAGGDGGDGGHGAAGKAGRNATQYSNGTNGGRGGNGGNGADGGDGGDGGNGGRGGTGGTIVGTLYGDSAFKSVVKRNLKYSVAGGSGGAAGKGGAGGDGGSAGAGGPGGPGGRSFYKAASGCGTNQYGYYSCSSPQVSKSGGYQGSSGSSGYSGSDGSRGSDGRRGSSGSSGRVTFR